MDVAQPADKSEQTIVDNVRGMKGWLRLMGVVSIVGGALQALTLIGIIWAWLPIWLGVLLTQAASQANEYADRRDMPALTAFTGKLRTYFVVSGVVTIVGLAMAAAGLIIALAFGLWGGLLQHWPSRFGVS